MKKVLIAGANSYIGGSFKAYLDQFPDKYKTDVLSMRSVVPTQDFFVSYDVVFCVVGIAHIKETNQNRRLYFEVNRDLVVAIAKAAKKAGVKQFILLSSMSVYGLTVGHIKKDTVPNPGTAYGKSKLQADEEIKKMENENFIFTCLRPPLVYGKGCRGNYQILKTFALKSPIFPNYGSQRSMIYIGNLCEFVKCCIDFERRGLFFPQNKAYVNTAKMVELVAKEHGVRIRFTKAFNWALKIATVNIIKKVFGDLTYELVDTVDKYEFNVTIRLTEGE